MTRPANFTRRSRSFVKRFAREGRWHLIPLYWLLRMSDFAREGMERSGSYRFADHLYRGVPSGRGWIGRRLDAALLNLPATRAMRRRCFEASETMRREYANFSGETFRILAAPCGIPRDFRDFTAQTPGARVEYTGVDLDPEVIAAGCAFLDGLAIPPPRWICDDALDRGSWPPKRQHLIVSTGLGEFLDDAALAQFYRNAYEALAPGGLFFTSATAREPRADWLLRAFELETQYRTSEEVARLLAGQPWESVEWSCDPSGLQTFVRARKGR